MKYTSTARGISAISTNAQGQAWLFRRSLRGFVETLSSAALLRVILRRGGSLRSVSFLTFRLFLLSFSQFSSSLILFFFLFLLFTSRVHFSFTERFPSLSINFPLALFAVRQRFPLKPNRCRTAYRSYRNENRFGTRRYDSPLPHEFALLARRFATSFITSRSHTNKDSNEQSARPYGR